MLLNAWSKADAAGNFLRGIHDHRKLTLLLSLIVLEGG
jgi:hypothetical protein